MGYIQVFRVKVCVVVLCDPNGGMWKKERFWNDLGKIVDRVGNGYRLCAGRAKLKGWR